MLVPSVDGAYINPARPKEYLHHRVKAFDSLEELRIGWFKDEALN
jgi:hypothetical protein